MKPILLFLLLSLFPILAQDTSIPATPSSDTSAQSLASQGDMLKKREETVKKLRALMENPATSTETKLKFAAAALDLLDQDTQMLQADHDLLVASQKALADKAPEPASEPATEPTKPKKPRHIDKPPDARVPALPAN